MITREITRQAFHPLAWYPQLSELHSSIGEIRAEAIHALEQMAFVSDERAKAQTWRVLPIKPEPEDVPNVPPSLINWSRKLAPKTTDLLDSIPGVIAYAFSALAAGAHIAPHQHDNPYVTAMLCLQAEGEVYMVNGGERREIREGEILVFDYTMMHEVENNGSRERIVLLVLLENALTSE